MQLFGQLPGFQGSSLQFLVLSSQCLFQFRHASRHVSDLFQLFAQRIILPAGLGQLFFRGAELLLQALQPIGYGGVLLQRLGEIPGLLLQAGNLFPGLAQLALDLAVVGGQGLAEHHELGNAVVPLDDLVAQFFQLFFPFLLQGRQPLLALLELCLQFLDPGITRRQLLVQGGKPFFVQPDAVPLRQGLVPLNTQVFKLPLQVGDLFFYRGEAVTIALHLVSQAVDPGFVFVACLDMRRLGVGSVLFQPGAVIGGKKDVNQYADNSQNNCTWLHSAAS